MTQAERFNIRDVQEALECPYRNGYKLGPVYAIPLPDGKLGFGRTMVDTGLSFTSTLEKAAATRPQIKGVVTVAEWIRRDKPENQTFVIQRNSRSFQAERLFAILTVFPVELCGSVRH